MLSVIFTQLTYIVKTLRWYSVNWYHFLSSRRRDLKLYWYREDKSICYDSWEWKSRAFIGKIHRSIPSIPSIPSEIRCVKTSHYLYLSVVCAPVGVEDPHIIPNAQITPSSYFLSYYAHMGRLNGVKCWCQKTTEITDDYIQVDMGALHTVCAIATQGKKNGSFVKSYKLSFSIDESSWSVYQEQNIDKVWNNSTLIFSCLF